MPVANIHEFSFRKPYRSGDYGFLDKLVHGKSIVQLGEAVHVTREFPLVKLSLIQYLHEEKGFDLLAFEGSLLQAWIAQDLMYLQRNDEADIAAQVQELALFPLYQSAEMRRVIEYVIASQSTENPLYLTSFDVQHARCRAFQGSIESAVESFVGALQRHNPTFYSSFITRWRTAEGLQMRNQSDLEALIEDIELWISGISHQVGVASGLIHAKALSCIPLSLRNGFRLFEKDEAGGEYGEFREYISARNVLELRNCVSESGKVMVWAHHRHVSRNSTSKNGCSMGYYLSQTTGDELLTIGLFAGGGHAFEVNDRKFPYLVPRRLRPSREYGVERQLSAASTHDFLLDLLPLSVLDSAWSEATFSRIETRQRCPTSLAGDFDAAIFIQTVHPATLTFLPRYLLILLTIYGFLLDQILWFTALLAQTAISFLPDSESPNYTNHAKE